MRLALKLAERSVKVGLFGGRAPEAEPAVKRMRRALKASGLKVTVQQVAYLTWAAQAIDDPSMAASYQGMQSQLELAAAEKSAADAFLTSAGVTDGSNG